MRLLTQQLVDGLLFKYTLQWCKVNEYKFRYDWHFYQKSCPLLCRVRPYCYCLSCDHAQL